MSRLNVGIPASRTAATARSTFAGSCVRPSEASTCGDIDCTPMLTRFTPPERNVRSMSTVTSSGLHSTVTSAPSTVGIDRDQLGERVRRDERRGAAADEDRCRRPACHRSIGPVDLRANSAAGTRRPDGGGRSTSRTRSSRTSTRRTGCGRYTPNALIAAIQPSEPAESDAATPGHDRSHGDDAGGPRIQAGLKSRSSAARRAPT